MAAEASPFVALATGSVEERPTIVVEVGQGRLANALPPQPPLGLDAPPTRVAWEARRSVQGVVFYHNLATGESRWVLPTGPFDIVVPSSAVGGGTGEPKLIAATSAPGAAGTGGGSSSSSSSSGNDSSEDSADPPGAGKPKGKVEAFRDMLRERGVGGFDRYEAWMPKLLSDRRFTAIALCDRKVLFQQEAKRLFEQSRRGTAAAKRNAFLTFAPIVAAARSQGLLHGARTTADALASIAKSDLGADSRFTSASRGVRERLIGEALREQQRERDTEVAESVTAFRALLQAAVFGPAAKACKEPPPFGDVRRQLREDPRWKAVSDAGLLQELFTAAAAEAAQRLQQRRRKRAEEEDELASRRLRMRRQDGEEAFRLLLTEHVTAPLQLTWPEARILLEDGLAKAPLELDEAAREAAFNELRQEALARCLATFADALRGIPLETVPPEESFEEARKAVAQQIPGIDGRLEGSLATELRRTWEDWRRARLSVAAEELRSWLREPDCQHVNDAAADAQALQGAGPRFEALCMKLSVDARYKRLRLLPGERRRIIVERLVELDAAQPVALDP